jgi:hypothetical protein
MINWLDNSKLYSSIQYSRNTYYPLLFCIMKYFPSIVSCWWHHYEETGMTRSKFRNENTIIRTQDTCWRLFQLRLPLLFLLFIFEASWNDSYCRQCLPTLHRCRPCLCLLYLLVVAQTCIVLWLKLSAWGCILPYSIDRLYLSMGCCPDLYCLMIEVECVRLPFE